MPISAQPTKGMQPCGHTMRRTRGHEGTWQNCPTAEAARHDWPAHVAMQCNGIQQPYSRCLDADGWRGRRHGQQQLTPLEVQEEQVHET
eukprot:359839-Chlamydomonas_euryale.AAC.16